MKKRLCILLLIAIMLLLPHAASANAPAPDPWELSVYLQNVPDGTTVTALFLQEDGTLRQGETYTSGGAKNWKIGVWFKEDEKQFCLTLTAPDGTETRTNEIAIEPYGSYTLDCETNTLTAGKPKGADSCTGGLGELCLSCGAWLLLYAFAGFFMPVAVTFLVEWLTALCFKIRPVRYVFAINAITNPLMNLLLLIANAFGRISYWVILIALEITVVFIEYAFYKKKYPDISRRRLLLFTITANVLSLLIGGLLAYFIL
jgi:hypothetical protein